MDILYIFFSIIGVIIIGVFFLNYLYKKTNSFNNQFSDVNKVSDLQKELDKSIDLVVLGSNAPKFAFDFSTTKNLTCRNLAIGPETFQYDFIILKKIINKIKTGGYVILPICPGKIFLNRYKAKSSYTKYYRILKKGEMPDYSLIDRLRGYTFPLIFNPRKVIKLLKDDSLDIRMAITKNSMTDQEVENDASWWINECWNPEFGIDIENMKRLPPSIKNAVEFNVGIISQISQLCAEHNLHLIMPILPLSSQLSSKFSEMYVEKYMKKPIFKVNEAEMIHVPDYMRDERFSSKENFINSFFMNRQGASKFTNVFIKENII